MTEGEALRGAAGHTTRRIFLTRLGGSAAAGVMGAPLVLGSRSATAGEAFMFEYAGGYWADRKRRAAEDDRERRRAAAAASGENDDDDDHLFFDAQEAPF